jgi:serine/threonine-protein kinase RsbW
MKLFQNLKRPEKLRKSKAIEKQLTVKSRTENLAEIRDFVRSTALDVGFSNETVENIVLAVDEACTNIIKHAYKFYPDGEILIKLKRSGGKFNIEIIDYGSSFEPEKVPVPDIQKFYQQHKVGGLGIYLMKTLMDDVKYVSVPGKYNTVRLSINLNAAVQ